MTLHDAQERANQLKAMLAERFGIESVHAGAGERGGPLALGRLSGGRGRRAAPLRPSARRRVAQPAQPAAP